MSKFLSQNFYFPQKNNMGVFGNITVFSSHVLIFANMFRKSQIAFWQMFDFYPTCLEKTKHVGIFSPGCYFPHMFGFWHIGMGKGTHVCKKPHNYMFANVWHFPHTCGKSHWHAYFPLSYGCFPVASIDASRDSPEVKMSSDNEVKWGFEGKLSEANAHEKCLYNSDGVGEEKSKVGEESEKVEEE